MHVLWGNEFWQSVAERSNRRAAEMVCEHFFMFEVFPVLSKFYLSSAHICVNINAFFCFEPMYFFLSRVIRFLISVYYSIPETKV